MKPLLILLFVFCCAQNSHSQNFQQTVRADASGVFYTSKMTNDTLVPPRRRGRSNVMTEAVVNVYYDFVRRDRHLQFRLGVGYSRKELVMNKTNLADFFLLFFATRNTRDTFRFSRIQYQYDYLNLPLGITYRLTQKDQSWFQVQAGLQANVGFCVNKGVQFEHDGATPRFTVAEEAEIRKLYNEGASAVVVGLVPRIDFNARIYKNVGIFYSVQFSTLQLNSFNKNIAAVGTGFGAGIGAYVNL